MGIGWSEERIIDVAKLIMAVRGYEKHERKGWESGIDYVASHPKSGRKILLRLVTKPRSESGSAGLDIVRQMTEDMKIEDLDEGVLISRGFTEAAKRESGQEGIQAISEKSQLLFNPQELYPAMRAYEYDLCQSKCGHLLKGGAKRPCEGEGEHQSCEVRSITDNAAFHFKRGWKTLLTQDFESLIKLRSKDKNYVNTRESLNSSSTY